MDIVKSLFEVGPDDEMIAVDAYNEPVDKYSPMDEDTLELDAPLTPPIENEAQLTEQKQKTAPKPPSSEANVAEMQSALSSLSPTAANATSGLSSQEKAELDAAMAKAAKEAEEDNRNVLVKNGLGAVSVVTPDGVIDFDEQEGLKVKGGMKVFANLLGDSFICGLLEEKGKLSSALKALFDLSLDIDIQECLSDLINAIKNPGLQKQVLTQAAKSFASKGQIGGLEKVLDNISADSLVSNTPDIAPTLLTNYKRPRFIDDGAGTGRKRPVTRNDDPALYTQLDDTLTQFDPNWGYYKRDEEWIPDAQIFRKLSPDAEHVIGTQRDKRVHIEVAKRHYPGNRKREAERRYPGAVIDPVPTGYAAQTA